MAKLTPNDPLAKAPQDRSADIKTAKKELGEIRRKKTEAIKLKLDYQFAQNEFVTVLSDLEQAEKDTIAEIKEFERNQAQIPDIKNRLSGSSHGIPLSV